MEITIERLDELQGIDFTDTPPCTMKRKRSGQWVKCGLPSVARVHCTCPCGREVFTFACKDCLWLVKNFPEASVCAKCMGLGTMTIRDA